MGGGSANTVLLPLLCLPLEGFFFFKGGGTVCIGSTCSYIQALAQGVCMLFADGAVQVHYANAVHSQVQGLANHNSTTVDHNSHHPQPLAMLVEANGSCSPQHVEGAMLVTPQLPLTYFAKGMQNK